MNNKNIVNEAFFWALQSICVMHKKPCAMELARQQFAGPHTVESLRAAVQSYGFDALSCKANPLSISPGMQVVAEINQGRRTVLEYLLSPVQRTVQEAGRER